jgi:hypothetical protein
MLGEDWRKHAWDDVSNFREIRRDIESKIKCLRIDKYRYRVESRELSSKW